MNNYQYFSDETEKKLIKDYRSGKYSLEELADKYHSSKYIVSKLLRSRGIKKPTLYEMNKTNIDNAIKYYMEHDTTIEALSHMLRISCPTLIRIFRANGIYKSRDMLSDNDIARIKELRASGVKVAEISKMFKRKPETIYRSLYKNDAGKKIDTGKIYALYKAGWKPETIAWEMTLTPETICGIIKDFDTGALEKPKGTWRDKAECF